SRPTSARTQYENGVRRGLDKTLFRSLAYDAKTLFRTLRRIDRMATQTAQRSAPLWFIDGLAYIHVSGEETDGRYSVLEILSPEGDMPPLHVHHDEDEVFHVLDGQVTLFLPGSEVPLAAGETFRAPQGIPHTYRVESPTARWLVFCAPARFDAFVRAVSE